MPSCSVAENPKGQKITFVEDTHKYSSIIDGKTISYVSGTQFIGSFFKPFDPTGEIAARCAQKRGISIDALKSEWKNKAAEACSFGTRVHEICEDVELGRDIRNSPETDKEIKVFANAKKMAKSFYDNIDILGVEKIVFSVQLKISGTIDLLARSRKTGEILIIDHKTNATIEKDNKYNKFAKDPISAVPDTNFYHYALQLNLYQYLLQKEKYVPEDSKFRLFLNHITENGAHLIELPTMQSEIKDMMIHHLAEQIWQSVQNN